MILLIGHGYWGKNIAKTLGNELYAVCDSNSEVLKEVSSLYPRTKLYSNIDTALADSNISAVIIATKASTHFNLAKRIIKDKKHIWIEKPACLTVNEIDHIIKLAEENEVKVFVDHIMCHDSTITYIKENFNLDKPIRFESYRLHQGLFQPDTDVLYDLAIHDLSIIDFLFPGINLIEKTIIKNNHVNEFPDQAILDLKFDNGLNATIICSWISSEKQRQIFITTEKESIYTNAGLLTIKNFKEKLSANYSSNSFSSEHQINVEQKPGLATAITSFKNMIAGTENPITDIYQAKRIQQWIEQ